MGETIYKHGAYPAHRAPPLRGYLLTATAYLKRRYPLASDEVIEKFVKQQMADSIQKPIVEILNHPNPGKTVRQKLPLLTYTMKGMAQNIITPSGSVYMLPTKRESFIKKSLADKLADRKVYKKKMLNALAVGNTIDAATYNFLQASTKIFINSAPGAMKSEYNCLYDLPGYNAITSTARQSVRYGYAQVERLVEGNLYLPTYEDLVNYCLSLLRAKPDIADRVIDTYGLHLPTLEETSAHFMESLKYYTSGVPMTKLDSFFSSFTPHERAFVVYAGSLKTLTRFNDKFFRDFFGEFFRTDMKVDDSLDPSDAAKFEDDLTAMITSLNYEDLGYQPPDPDKPGEAPKRNELRDAIVNNPEGARKIVAIGKHMEANLDRIAPLLTVLFRIDADIANLLSHPNMMRRCVIISDTDSVIFSTQSMVEWYSKRVTFTKPSYEINAFTVYLISRTLEHVFARLSSGFGMIGDDIKKIAMKNEFLYPIMMRTPIAKHYAGITTFQEGKLLAKPKKDIKGLQFRSSTLSAATIKAAEDFLVNDILKKVMAEGVLHADELQAKVAGFELDVYKSLAAGERAYLQTISVKPGDEYADPDRTQFFYYEMWEKVFVPRFDSIVLPNKCFKLPLRREGKCLKEPGFLEKLRDFDEGCHDRLIRFMDEIEKNKLSYLLIPPTMTVVPEIFKDLLDFRSIIYTNTHPFYLGMESLGFGYCFNPTGKPSTLVSDFFTVYEGQPEVPF